jgi:hypothetical protein
MKSTFGVCRIIQGLLQVATKKFTIKQIVDAIRQNGLPKGKYKYVTRRNGVPVSGCALGQAALNLGVGPVALANAFMNREWESGIGRIANNIISLNDNTAFSLAEIADRIENQYSALLSDEISVRVNSASKDSGKAPRPSPSL